MSADKGNKGYLTYEEMKGLKEVEDVDLSEGEYREMCDALGCRGGITMKALHDFLEEIDAGETNDELGKSRRELLLACSQVGDD